MIYLKTPEEIEKIAKASDLISLTFGEVAKWIAPGVTTHRLDSIAREFILDNGGKPACLGYQGFPATLCIEVNETVVHGFPSAYTLREGDIVGIDTVVTLDGYNSDMCYTFPVGEISQENLRLLTVAREALDLGIRACQPGKRIGDISSAIQTHCEKAGFNVNREYCGHGIGRRMHEDPQIPNYGRPGIGPLIKNGMCLCIEPMVNAGAKNVRILPDGWTCVTRDGKPSAHFEHTVAILNGQTRQLTTFDHIKEALKDRFI